MRHLLLKDTLGPFLLFQALIVSEGTTPTASPSVGTPMFRNGEQILLARVPTPESLSISDELEESSQLEAAAVNVLLNRVRCAWESVDPTDEWHTNGGPKLLARANDALRDAYMPKQEMIYRISGFLILAGVILLPDTQNLLLELGLVEFCQTHSQILQGLLLDLKRWSQVIRELYSQRGISGRATREIVRLTAIPLELCPNLFTTSEFRQVALLQRLLKEPVKGEIAGVLGVRREAAFEDSVNFLVRPVDEVRGVVNAVVLGFEGSPSESIVDWFMAVAAILGDAKRGVVQQALAHLGAARPV